MLPAPGSNASLSIIVPVRWIGSDSALELRIAHFLARTDPGQFGKQTRSRANNDQGRGHGTTGTTERRASAQRIARQPVRSTAAGAGGCKVSGASSLTDGLARQAPGLPQKTERPGSATAVLGLPGPRLTARPRSLSTPIVPRGNHSK
jgi:hypothetical protein